MKEWSLKNFTVDVHFFKVQKVSLEKLSIYIWNFKTKYKELFLFWVTFFVSYGMLIIAIKSNLLNNNLHISLHFTTSGRNVKLTWVVCLETKLRSLTRFYVLRTASANQIFLLCFHLSDHRSPGISMTIFHHETLKLAHYVDICHLV